MQGYEINKLVDEHFYIGSDQLRSYKKIIKKAAYPPFNHSLDLEIASDAIDSYVKSGGLLENTIELMVFFVECGTHFSADFGGDIGEDFYAMLEDKFEEVLKKLKTTNNETLLSKFTPRIKSIMKVAHESGWGYGDQLEDYWQDIFGE
jgi:hypothetical protein